MLTRIVAGLLVAVATTAAAGPIEDARAAYGQGDLATELRIIRSLAEQGFSDAQNYLGFLYFRGEGVPQDNIEAAKWFRLAAEHDFALAQYSLGFIYLVGRGVQPDNAEAVKWFRLAAAQGFAVAQYTLAFMYFIGRGAPQDRAEAVKWVRLAAEQGNADAQFRPGVSYAYDRGVAFDYVLARMWFDWVAFQEGDRDPARRDNVLSPQLTPNQLADAQRMARDWKTKKQP